MDEEISSAVSYALNKGFQIHPDALEILHKIDVKELGQIIKDVVKEKTKQKVFLINEEDFEIYLGIKDDEEHQVEFEILSDPTEKITSAEGVEGYVKYKGKVDNIIYQLVGGLKSSMGYLGSKKVIDLRKKPKFFKITKAGFYESMVHNIDEVKK